MAKRRTDTEAELLGSFARLDEQRAPYADLLGELVAGTLERFPLPSGAPALEIGAGAGQLHAWLPEGVRARVLHTEPSAAALARLRARAPRAAVAAARAQALPARDGSCGGVLGLCVFDTLHGEGTEGAAAAEIARVLAPGGRFIHFLDMATLLETPFTKLAAAELAPLPNLFGDPSDHEWPLDLVLVKRAWLSGLLAFARRAGHPLPAAFAALFDELLRSDFDARRAVGEFKRVSSDSARRRDLLAMLASAATAAQLQGHPPFEALPFHSSKYLATLLEQLFGGEGATFEVELAEIVAASAWRQLPEGGAIRYRGLCAGNQRVGDQLPRRLLSPSARDRMAAGGAPPDQALVEAAMFAFVARKR